VPKVSAEHLEARRRQILDAARACFARRGFHQATMQDICDEARLSAGAVYRYFRSKEAIIAALNKRDLERNTALIEGAAERDTLMGAIDDMVEAYFLELIEGSTESLHLLEIEVIAEAIRNPQVGDLFRQSFQGLRGSFALLIRKAQERGEIAPRLDPEAIAAAGISFYYGLLIQKTLDPTVDGAKYVEVIKALLGGTFHLRPAPH
jgi:AcrR family transcriptional regulator